VGRQYLSAIQKLIHPDSRKSIEGSPHCAARCLRTHSAGIDAPVRANGVQGILSAALAFPDDDARK
jgi:hypothetical protein